jgi:hypothetical protein
MNDLTLCGISALLMGVVWFLSSLQAYRQKHKIADTPVSRCDALAAGKVAVAGIAHAERLHFSLFSQNEGIFFHYRIMVLPIAQPGQPFIAKFIDPPNSSFTLTDQSGSITVLAGGIELAYRLRDGSNRTEYIYDPRRGQTAIKQSGLDILQRYGSLEDTVFRIEEVSLLQNSQVYVYGFASASVPQSSLVIHKGSDGEKFLLGFGTRSTVLLKENTVIQAGLYGGPIAIIIGIVLLWEILRCS